MKRVLIAIILILALCSSAYGEVIMRGSTGALGAVTGIVKGSAGTFTAAVSGTDYIAPTEVDGHANASPSAATLANGPTIYNYGQGAGDVNITLPTAAANLSFLATVGTAQAANYWRFTSADAGTMYLDGSATGKNYVQFAAPAVGNYFACFTFKTGASAYSWICSTGNGVLTTN